MKIKATITLLATCVAALLTLGLVMLYSASMVQAGAGFLTRQLIWCALAVPLCIAAATIDYRVWKKGVWLFLGISVVLLILVKLLGVKVKGGTRWLELGGFRLQPSEFAKLAIIIFVAWYAEKFHRHMGTFKKGLLIPGAIVGVVLGLIFIEPDRGATALLATVTLCMLIVSGVRLVYMVPPVVVGVALFAFSLWHDPMRMRRIMAWLNPEATKEGTGYQAFQAKIALGAGGVTGLGLGDSRQKLGFVPEHQTDFILSIIGEELGLIATLAVVAGFVCIVICGIRIALRARDSFGYMLASGITFLIGLQAFINIGVVTGTLPNKGLSLPFISYGGSNLLMMLLSVGILLNVARNAEEPEEALVSAGGEPRVEEPAT